MSVAEQLGLTDPHDGLLGQARAAWPRWVGEEPALGVVADLLDLDAWTRAASREDVDAVLRVLARLASPTGGDDRVAAGALAWLLLPGASRLAHTLRGLSDRIDEVVAAQLWLEVRSFAWQRLRNVAANILYRTRAGVLGELREPTDVCDLDEFWVAVPGDGSLWGESPGPGGAPAGGVTGELALVLAWALEQRAVERSDVDLLLDLAVEAHTRAGHRQGRRGRGGLCSGAASMSVAARRGLAAQTVRRRAQASMRAIAAAWIENAA